jgi:hypothetical protein
VHGEHAATWHYRTGGLGTAKRLGESITPEDWYLPLRMAWLSLAHPGRLLLGRLGGKPQLFLDVDLESRVSTAIEAVRVRPEVAEP